jgi:hypothetical protein
METLQEKTGIKGRVRIIQKRAGTEEIVAISEWDDNLVMRGVDTGLDVILDRLAGNLTYSLDLTYADIGTGTNTPAITDTTLQTPTVRALRALASVSGASVTMQYFFTDAALANATYREFGTFMDGSATISTGRIFNRILFSSPYVKTSGIDTTVEVQFTVS